MKNEGAQIQKQNYDGLSNLKVGHATFKKSMTNKIITKLVKKRKTSILNSNIWKIQYGMFNRQKWDDVLQYMQSSSCERIDLHDNQNPFLLKKLCLPQFTHLVTLVLQKNQIVSVEGLAFLNMPKINFLDLDDNLLTNIECMNKLNWASFHKFQIRNNNIQWFDISRTRTFRDFKKIYMDQARDTKVCLQDLSQLMKMENVNLNNLQIQSEKRIQQKRILKVLREKHVNIIIDEWDIDIDGLFPILPLGHIINQLPIE